MKAKQLLLTFDYELFLGDNSGSVHQCMLTPTEKIIPILKKHGLKAIFFIDTTYLMQLEKQALSHSLAKNDFDRIIKQLSNLMEDGHHLFHHLHPHWLDAIYHPASNTWDCSNHTRFALSNLTDEQVSSLFTYSDNFIKRLYSEKNRPVNLGFRAGGLYSQPFERLTPLFKQKKIKYDFSVLKGAQSQQSTFSFDYTQALYIKENNYHFEVSNTVVDTTGYFVEFSMSNFSMSFFQRIMNSIYYRLNVRKLAWKRFGDGNSSGNTIQRGKNDFSSKETFSIELLNKVKAFYYFFYLKRHSSIHLISHPKLLSPQSISSFELFIRLTKKRYSINSKFETFL